METSSTNDELKSIDENTNDCVVINSTTSDDVGDPVLANPKLYGKSFDKKKDFTEFKNHNIITENAAEDGLDVSKKFMKMNTAEKMEFLSQKFLNIQKMFTDSMQMMDKMKYTQQSQ